MEEQNNTKKNIFKIAVDLLFSIGGLVAMNGVIQLLLYPSMKKALGDEVFGNIISLLAVVSLLATSFGTAANYARMVAKKDGRSNNGDFNIFLLLSFIPAVAIICVASYLILGEISAVALILICFLCVFSILRYYGDVEYRLNVNYKMFFIYYLIISVGCVIGSILVKKHVFGDNFAWIIGVTAGEFLCFLFVLFSGSIYKGKDVLKRSSHFGQNIKTIMFLVGTNFISALVLQADKLLLKAFQSGEAVTIFYVATLIGKIIALLTTPLNSIIIGYLTKYEGKITKRFFSCAVGVALLVGIVFTAGGFFVSHGFVYLMYNDLYETAKQYFLLANAGQVLYFVSGSMMIVVLRFVHEKYQLIINICYAVLFAAIVVPLVYFFGLWGITWGLFVVNAIRLGMVICIGFFKTEKPKNRKTEEQKNRKTEEPKNRRTEKPKNRRTEKLHAEGVTSREA